MTSPLRVLPARRGLPIALLFALVTFAGYVGRRDEWVGIWSESNHALDIGLILVFPAAAASGAWLAVSNHRAGLSELEVVAARTTWHVELRTLAEFALWVLLGTIVGVAPLVTLTAVTATYGSFNALALCANLSFVLAGLTLGYRAGRLFRSYFVVVAAAAGTYILFGIGRTNGSLLAALTPVDTRRPLAFQMTPSVLVLETMFALFVASAVLMAHRPRLGVLLAWLAGLTASPLILIGAADRELDTQALRLECRGEPSSSLEVCVPQPKSFLIQDLSNYVSDAREFAPSLFPTRLVVIDDEYKGISEAGDDDLRRTQQEYEQAGGSVLFLSAFSDISAYATVDREAFLANLFSYLYSGSTTQDLAEPTELSAAQPKDVLLRWTLEELDIATDGSAYAGAPQLDDQVLDFTEAVAALDRLREMNDGDREDWFASHSEDIRSGTLTLEVMESG